MTRKSLLKNVREQGALDERGAPNPVVPLRLIFEGNGDIGSIGCNLIEHPGINRYYEVLREIEAKPEVQGVFVEISEIEPDNESSWPFSERVYVLTSSTLATVESWLVELQPSDVTEGWLQGKSEAAPESEPGNLVCSVWWD